MTLELKTAIARGFGSKRWAFLLALTALLAVGCRCSGGDPSIRVLTDRTASKLENLFKFYEDERQVKIAVNFVGDALLTRLAERPKEADLVITKNADLLEIAKQKKLLEPFQSQRILGNVPAPFRDADRDGQIDRS